MSSPRSPQSCEKPGNTNCLSKVLLMGRAGAGKTSMRSIIFASYVARETTRLQPTNQVEHSTLRFLGNLTLTLWDCGGQDVFMENYFESQKEHIFKNSMVLIYVMSVGGDVNKEISYFRSSIESLRAMSPNARVFCLIHKFDLVPPVERQHVFARHCDELRSIAAGIPIEFFATSIWDESLYKAWSRIVRALIPNASLIEKQLTNLSEVVNADEIVLFEKATFLVISHISKAEISDPHRFEKISNIVKQFKLSVNKQHASISSMEIKTDTFRAMIEKFSPKPAATICNLSVARDMFRKLSDGTKLL